MYSLGHTFMPPPIHAGGLRYHGMAPTVSQLAAEGIIEPKAISQNPAYEAGITFARTEGIIPAPETTHALACVIDEAKKAKEEGQEKVILFNWSGHGLLDLAAYDKYFARELEDYILSEEEISKSEKVFENFPKPQKLSSRAR